MQYWHERWDEQAQRTRLLTRAMSPFVTQQTFGNLLDSRV